MNLLALDTETALSSEFCKAPPLACVSWARPDGTADLWHHSDDRLEAWLAEQLARATIIGHTIHYDMGVILARFPRLVTPIFRAYRDGRVLDLRLAQKLADISAGEHEAPRHCLHGRPYTLEAIVWRHLRREMDKHTHRLRYGEYRELPLEAWPASAREYPITDARYTLDAFLAVVRKYGEVATGDLVRQTQHALALHLVTCWGIRTDVDLATKIRDGARARHDELGRRLLAAGLLRQDKHKVVKPQQPIRDLVLWASKETRVPFALTKTGSDKEKKGETFDREDYIAADAETCEDYAALLAPTHPAKASLLESFAEYSSLGTRLTNQFPYLLRGEIHSKFESLRETGRTSSGGGDGLERDDGTKIKGGYNTQNTPQGDPDGLVLGERECFVPRPGYVFGDNDYSGLEACTGAQMCVDQYGFSHMADVLRAPPPYNDVHNDFAAVILGCSVDDVIRGKKAQERRYVIGRDVAKQCNFGLGGGMGKVRFVSTCKKKGVVITIDEAARYKRLWTGRWTEYDRHFAWAKSLTGSFEAPKRARIQLLRVKRWRGGLKYAELCNTPFQSLGADTAKDALFDVIQEMYDPSCGSVLFGSRVVNFVHDQIISEFPIFRAHACAMRQTEVMNAAGRRWLPDCPAHTAPTLAARWSKSARETWSGGKPGEGELVTWEHRTILAARAA